MWSIIHTKPYLARACGIADDQKKIPCVNWTLLAVPFHALWKHIKLSLWSDLGCVKTLLFCCLEIPGFFCYGKTRVSFRLFNTKKGREHITLPRQSWADHEIPTVWGNLTDKTNLIFTHKPLYLPGQLLPTCNGIFVIAVDWTGKIRASRAKTISSAKSPKGFLGLWLQGGTGVGERLSCEFSKYFQV